ncbi:MAG: AmmeMemoRadiSam system protein B [Planctomycetes bacterium]|nr:AmmeMemoRadiSam system protein B [Planctomycetota bacterium]
MKTLLSTTILFIIVLITPAVFAQTEQEVASPEVWEAQVAGRFYPGNETALKDQITAFFQNVPGQAPKGAPIAIISPHAGYQYSGQVAAYGYSAIKDRKFDRVIILALKHQLGLKRIRGISVSSAKNFKTPLGLIPVDRDACGQLLKASNLFGTYESASKEEHSLETQLPFLQMSIKDFKIIPLSICFLMKDDFDPIANAIKPLISDSTLIVVSSDFTHYGENYGFLPFKNDIEKNIRKYDYGLFEKILSKDFEGLKAYRQYTQINACGILPIALLLKLLPGDAQGEILNYDTSGHQLNNFSSSVSYASILFTRPAAGNSGDLSHPKDATGKQQSFLTDQEKSILLSLARNTLKTHTSNGGARPVVSPELSLTPRLMEKYGVFVTLKKGGELRGCIGHIAPREPLFRGVIENTVNSSSNDWRFRPVDAGEISDITIEISVLSQPKMIKGPDEFVVGREGIIIRKGHASAVFLPQVATEQGWDRDETLCRLCQKAGLSENAWKDDETEFYVFTADVFCEGEKT